MDWPGCEKDGHLAAKSETAKDARAEDAAVESERLNSGSDFVGTGAGSEIFFIVVFFSDLFLKLTQSVAIRLRQEQDHIAGWLSCGSPHERHGSSSHFVAF